MEPRINRSVWVAIVAAALPFVGACVWTPELTEVKQDLAREVPGLSFEHNLSLAIGPGAMALARAASLLVPGARDARGWLRDVSRVELAVYDVRAAESTPLIETPSHVRKLIDEGWEMAVRVRERDQAAWLLYRIEDDSIREVFVVALDHEELVIVKVKGRLEHLIARALSDSNHGPDLHHPLRHRT